ncbi:MAG: hypothetical protein CVU64_22560, partial [Deltaproteobacteria bacterium HGW-Deltaproteobacteria-21]
YVHDFVLQYIDGQWKEYADRSGINGRRKSDFAVGVLDGFRNRLEEKAQIDTHREENLSLIKVEDKELEREIAYRYPHLRKIRGWLVRRDERVRRDGMKIGRNLVIYKGIEEQGSTEGKRMLPLHVHPAKRC